VPQADVGKPSPWPRRALKSATVDHLVGARSNELSAPILAVCEIEAETRGRFSAVRAKLSPYAGLSLAELCREHLHSADDDSERGAQGTAGGNRSSGFRA
jgi:hypothetical protein